MKNQNPYQQKKNFFHFQNLFFPFFQNIFFDRKKKVEKKFGPLDRFKIL